MSQQRSSHHHLQCNCKSPTASLAHHAQTPRIAHAPTASHAPADSDGGFGAHPARTLLLDDAETNWLGPRFRAGAARSRRHGTTRAPSPRDYARAAAAAHRLLVRCVRRCVCMQKVKGLKNHACVVDRTYRRRSCFCLGHGP